MVIYMEFSCPNRCGFFSSSSLSAIRVVGSAYLSLLIFLPYGCESGTVKKAEHQKIDEL